MAVYGEQMLNVPLRRRLYFAGLVVSGSVLYALPVVNDTLSVFVFVSTVPWLLLASDTSISHRASATLFLISVYGAGLLFLPWLRSFNTVGWLIAPLFYVPLFLPILLISRVLRAAWVRLPLSVVWPIAFTAGEFVRIRLSAGEIPFGQLGACMMSFDRLVQTADLAGVWALTFLASLVAGHLVDGTALVQRRQGSTLRSLAITSAVIAAGVGAMVAYGVYQLGTRQFSPGPRILVVQPNFATWDVTPAIARDRFGTLLRLTRAAAGRAQADLIAWPENSVIPLAPYDALGRGVDQDQQLRVLAAETHAAVLIDGPTILKSIRHHTAAVVYPDGHVAQYHKRLLVPWSECVPYEEALRHLNDGLARWFIGFVRAHNPHLQLFAPGSASTTFSIAVSDVPAAFAAPICYETLSAPYMRAWSAAARRGGAARFFAVNPVNEKLLGDAVHTKTLAFCRFRAIEARMTVIRAANNGISAAIDPNGHVYAIARGMDGRTVDRAGTFKATVFFDRRFGTIYSRLGDWLPLLCLAAGGAALGRCWISRDAGRKRPSAETVHIPADGVSRANGVR
jgi:apolipoprotein N-acyltransferase